MLTTALLLLRSSLFLSLHLAGNSGSFPRPLSAQEEQECLRRCAEGDLEARNTLVEHNMRLVAHIINKGYPSRKDFPGAFRKCDIHGKWELIERLQTHKCRKTNTVAAIAATVFVY